MKKRILSCLLALMVLVGVLPVAFSANSISPGYRDLTIEYLTKENGVNVKIAPDYKASLLPNSTYSIPSPSVAGYQVEDSDRSTVAGTLGDSDTTIQVFYTLTNNTTQYTISYEGRKLDGTEDTNFPEETVTGSAGIDTIVNAPDKVFLGYVREPGPMTLLVTADGNAQLTVYYTEALNPCIVFSTSGSAVDPFTAAKDTDIASDLEAHIQKYTGKTPPPSLAMETRVLNTRESGFRYYQQSGDLSENAFQELLTWLTENALYDTGIKPEYGEQVVLLSTCSYHTENGRFLVAAKKVGSE